MRHESRAIVFDLDDTLYPYRRFQVSGFAAVADHLSRVRRINRKRALRAMCRASQGETRGREIQVLLELLGLPPGLLSGLTDVMRGHQPRLRLHQSAAVTLAALRPGWKLGLLTNGNDGVQARKISALGLAGRVDSIVYATRYGTGVGKPEAAPFKEILKRLGMSADRAIFVGNVEVCDIGGAAALGMRTVRVTEWSALYGPSRADAVIASLRDLPAVAGRLLGEAPVRDAA
jgi:putative hydrolase of the HAD superfamily